MMIIRKPSAASDGKVESLGSWAIVVADITCWTKICYNAVHDDNMESLAEALADFHKEAFGFRATFEAFLNAGGVIGLANQMGDGFLALCKKPENTEALIDRIGREFEKLKKRLTAGDLAIPHNFGIRIALHYGPVWQYHPWKQKSLWKPSIVGNNTAQAAVPEREFVYIGDAVNLACRLVSCGLARRHRAVCSQRFIELAKPYEHYTTEETTTDFCGAYPEPVRIHGLDW